MRLLTPTTLNEALEYLAAAPADEPLIPVAGGTDLLVSWHHHAKDDWNLLDLSRLHDALQPIRLTDTGLQLGGLTTYWDVISSEEVGAAFPLLSEAARQVGAIQIQTRGTWAGNIGNSSPAADGVPVMMVYDALVVLQSLRERREVPLDRYYTGYKQTVRRPDELIVAIHMPRRRRTVEWFHKVGARAAQAIAKLGVAVVQDECGWRVAANSVAPVVCRCRHLEAALADGVAFARVEDLQAILSKDVSPIDDLRSTARYRESVLARLLYDKLVANGD